MKAMFKKGHWLRVPVGFALLAALALVVAAPLTSTSGVPGPGGYLWLALFCVAGAVVWRGWVMPMVEPVRLKAHLSPQRQLRRQRLWAWLPTALAGVWVVTDVAAATVLTVRGRPMMNLWLLAILLIGVLAATMPISHAVANQSEARFLAHVRQHGRCFICGYDLRGRADAIACPECGAVPERPPGESASRA